MIELGLGALLWGGVTAVLLVGGLLFGYYCAAKVTIELAGVTAPDEQQLFDRNAVTDSTDALSAEQIDEIEDWDDTED